MGVSEQVKTKRWMVLKMVFIRINFLKGGKVGSGSWDFGSVGLGVIFIVDMIPGTSQIGEEGSRIFSLAHIADCSFFFFPQRRHS